MHIIICPNVSCYPGATFRRESGTESSTFIDAPPPRNGASPQSVIAGQVVNRDRQSRLLVRQPLAPNARLREELDQIAVPLVRPAILCVQRDSRRLVVLSDSPAASVEIHLAWHSQGQLAKRRGRRSSLLTARPQKTGAGLRANNRRAESIVPTGVFRAGRYSGASEKTDDLMRRQRSEHLSRAFFQNARVLSNMLQPVVGFSVLLSFDWIQRRSVGVDLFFRSVQFVTLCRAALRPVIRPLTTATHEMSGLGAVMRVSTRA